MNRYLKLITTGNLPLHTKINARYFSLNSRATRLENGQWKQLNNMMERFAKRLQKDEIIY